MKKIGLLVIIFSIIVSSNICNAQEIKATINDKKGISNILLIGVDGQEVDEPNRSDTMIILTIDENNKNLKLTSLGRDTFVYIEGHGKEKLTHAYAYGGADLLLKTINQNFGINIDKYATVSFTSFMNVIDILDGVEVVVKENDLENLNKLIKVCYSMDKDPNKEKIEYIKEGGTYNLNGYQALAFSRMRYQDSTEARDSRQRMVIKSSLDKLKRQGLNIYMSSLNEILSGTKTNLSVSEILKLGFKTLKIGTNNIKSKQFPIGAEEIKTDEYGWIVIWDEEENIEILNGFIYENKN
ncbi:MAG: LCP family protein [Peptostreptococcaceae bacterium]